MKYEIDSDKFLKKVAYFVIPILYIRRFCPKILLCPPENLFVGRALEGAGAWADSADEPCTALVFNFFATAKGVSRDA